MRRSGRGIAGLVRRERAQSKPFRDNSPAAGVAHRMGVEPDALAYAPSRSDDVGSCTSDSWPSCSDCGGCTSSD